MERITTAKVDATDQSNRNGFRALRALLGLAGGYLRTGDIYQPSQVDARPLPGDRAAMVPDATTDGVAAVGFLNPADDSEVAPGEILLYSRDPSTGDKVARFRLYDHADALLANSEGGFELHADGRLSFQGPVAGFDLLADGTITVENANASVEISADGTISVTTPGASLTISPSGAVALNSDATVSITAATTVTVNAQNIALNGAVAVVGSLSVNGVFSQSGGLATVNGVTITTGGAITTSGAVSAGAVSGGGVSLSSHVHSGVTAGMANSGGPI